MRSSRIKRTTAETDITLEINLDGSGKSNIKTGCGFLDHMLTLFARHARFDLDVECKGDTYVDYHHTVEDVGANCEDHAAEALRYGLMSRPRPAVPEAAVPAPRYDPFDTGQRARSGYRGL